MLELKSFSKETRQTMLLNMEYYSQLIWHRAKFLSKAEAQLTKEFGNKFKSEIRVILSFCAKSLRYNTDGFRISLDSKDYTAANKTYKLTSKNSLSVTRMSTLLTLLDEAGYISFLKGFWTSKDSELSAVVLKTITSMINKDVAKQQAPSRDNLGVVEVVDTAKTTTKKVRTSNGMVKTKKFVFKDNKHVRGVRQYSDFIYSMNTLINKNVVTICDKVVNNITYKIRFEDDVTKCGRMYAGSFQTMESCLRSTITIGGNATCELDFSTCQPRMLAQIKGVTLPDNFDAYAIEGLSRTFAKSLLFPVLFSESRKDAKTSITNKIKEHNQSNPENVITLTSEDILKLFEAHNSYMADMFFNKSLYQTLQHHDSQIAIRVIKHFMNKGVVVLSYHDSFVIDCQYKEELEQVMQQEWYNEFNSNTNCVVKVSFDNTPVEDTLVEETVVGHTQVLIPVEFYMDTLPEVEENTYSDMEFEDFLNYFN